ncbi:MAG: class I SAM-dependent methyltransferase [Cyanobacteriota bacterium]|nr:class I SAM-dependent methyltransferase [Cyanobacteriota bacterium]
MQTIKNLLKDLLPPLLYRSLKSLKPNHPSEGKPFLGEEKSAEFYERQFINEERWKTHYTESGYYPLWSVLADRLVHSGTQSILDIGCGSGQMARLLRDKNIPHYLGFDFSSTRTEYAKQTCPEFEFVFDDAFQTDLFYTYDYDTVVCTEFLEHVEKDLEVIEKIRQGTHFYATVPNYPAPAHVRVFEKVDEVIERYGKYFQSFSVIEHLVNTKGMKLYLFEGIKC